LCAVRGGTGAQSFGVCKDRSAVLVSGGPREMEHARARSPSPSWAREFVANTDPRFAGSPHLSRRLGLCLLRRPPYAGPRPRSIPKAPTAAAGRPHGPAPGRGTAIDRRHPDRRDRRDSAGSGRPALAEWSRPLGAGLMVQQKERPALAGLPLTPDSSALRQGRARARVTRLRAISSYGPLSR